MITLIIFLLVSFCVFFELWKYYIEKTALKSFGCLKGYPILGSIPYAIGLDNESIINFITNVFQTIQKKPFFLWLGMQLMVCTDHPDDIQTILNSTDLLSKSYLYDSFQISSSLLCSPVHKWKRHRRALSPTLSAKMVNSFLPIFNEVFHEMVKYIERYVGTFIDPNRMMVIASYTTFMRTSMGADASFTDPVADQMHQLLGMYMHFVERRIQRPWLKWDFIYRWSADYGEFKMAKDTICAHLEYRRKIATIESYDSNDVENKMRLNWLQKCELLKSAGEFDDVDVSDELLVALIGSTDTSAATMTAILLMLAIHQNVQQLCVDELGDIVGNIDEPIGAEHLPKMVYIEMVIKEALRLYPINSFLVRENVNPVRLRDATIPASTQCLMYILRMHRDPTIWGETHDQFCPERFSPENYSNIHPYAFLPFSAGPRNCIGLRYAWPSLKIALSYLLRWYKFTTDITMDDVRFEMNAVSKIINTDVIRIERRG